MERIKYLTLSICVFCAICVFYEPHDASDRFQTDFPLTAEVVTDALARSGLAGEISESESEPQAGYSSSFVIRDKAKATEAAKNGRFVATITSAERESGRVLYIVFDQEIESEQIDWDAWKPQLIFAALLYGGFEDEEALYRALLGNELPEGQTQVSWSSSLPEGYCIAAYMPRTNTTYDENNIPVKRYAAHLQVNLYESHATYQAVVAEIATQLQAS